MAIQNFISGGYYGKLGATVGQRWKNKRIIRTYVIPRNPRTAEQQANRGQFGEAVQYSQIALQMNYYATCFENESYTRWNYRMKTAKNLVAHGAINLDRIPLYPENFVVPYQITSCTLVATPDTHTATLQITGNFPNENRNLSVIIDEYTAGGVEIGLKMYIAEYNASNVGFLTLHVDDTNELNSNCKLRIVSNDDVDSALDMFASSELQLQSGGVVDRPFNYAIQQINKTKSYITIVFNEPFVAATATAFAGALHAVSSGAVVDLSGLTSTLINVDGYFAAQIALPSTYEEQVPAFPAGSYVSITNVSASGASFNYHSENVTVNYSDADLTRSVEQTPIKDMALGTKQRLTWSISSSDTAVSVGAGGIISHAAGASRTPVATTWTSDNNAGSLSIYADSNANGAPMITGDSVSYPALNSVSNGVTYSVPAGSNVPFTNNITTYTLNQNITPLYYSKDMGGAGSVEQIYIEAESFTGSEVEDIDLDFTGTAELVMQDGNNEEITNGYIELDPSYNGVFYLGIDDPEATEGRTINTLSIAAGAIQFESWGITYSLPNISVAWASIPDA